MADKAQRVSISLYPDVLERLASRQDKALGGRSETITEDLQLLWATMERGIKIAQNSLTERQARLVVDVQSGSFFNHSALSMSLGGLSHSVSDGISLDGLDKKWEVDGPATVKAVEDLCDIATLALLDWCKQMWSKCNDNEHWEAEFEKFKKD